MKRLMISAMQSGGGKTTVTCALLAALVRLLPLSPLPGLLAGAALCLLFARLGFDALVARAYPILGAVCTGLLALLSVPLFPSASRQNVSSSAR